MPRDLVVIGGGEHARVVIDAACTEPECWNVIGYADLQRNEETERRFGITWLGNDRAVSQRHAEAAFVLAILGVPAIVRSQVLEVYRGRAFASVVHRDASVATTADIGPGVVVLARAVVNTGARVGAHAVINSGAIVEHDVDVGAEVHIAPGATLGGGVQIGEGTVVGLGARVRDHIHVGARVTVGMGAVVIDNVPSGVTIVGVPARVLLRT